jgi:predicted HicB family RNase H-like nuclease
MGLPYSVEITPISVEDGGGFLARIPLFGAQGIVGDGSTIEEAVENLKITKKIIFNHLISENIEIPEPEAEKQIDDFSGKIMVRMPKWLHHKLTVNAEKNNSSLNLYINTLLSSAVEQDVSLSRYEEIKSYIVNTCDCVKEIKDNIASKILMTNYHPGYSDDYSYRKAA